MTSMVTRASPTSCIAWASSHELILRISSRGYSATAATSNSVLPAVYCLLPTVNVAAIQVAERLGPDAKVVTLIADSGLKYLNTDVYRSS